MSEEKKEYNTIEEDMTQNETEEILEEDDVKLAEETVSETEETEETVEEKTAEKKGLFGKKKKDKKDEKIEELTDMVKRQMAEFDNFRKRTEKEKASMYQIGAREIVEKILPVVDNFERGLAMIPEDEKENPVATGMAQIYKQLMTAFDEIGVKAIEAVGQEFNPDFHNAVMHVEDESGERIADRVYLREGTSLSTDFLPVKIGNSMPGLVVSFMNASRIQQMENQIRRQMSDKGLAARYTFQDIVHKSDIMDRTIENAGRYAGVSSNVLLVGETGTGKELFAQSIHNASKRAGNAFVAVNCAALPESLLESELFGYVEGAFTGSKKGGKMGLFEMAHKGTLFLDEIAEIPLTFQSKLLRVLQEREVRRVGGNSVISVDVRIIAATNKNLQRQVSEGKFRQDLLYRLNVLRLYIPPLRKRSEDIPLLFHYYLQYYSNQFGYEMPILSAGAEEIIEQYAFTGNIRELRNIAERLSVVHSGFMITEEEMAAALGQDDIEITEYSERTMTTGPSYMMYAEGKREQEKQYIQRLLSEHGYNRSETARAMGIDRSTLWRKMKKYGLQ